MSVILGNIASLLIALVTVNIQMTLTAVLIAFPIACLFALGRLSRRPVIYFPVTAYVNVLRSSPFLMILFWAYFTAPMITGRSTSAYLAAVMALSVFEVAYFTEIVRAGLQAVPKRQRSAGLATGLTSFQANLQIILPQAMRKMIPSLLTQSIIAFQDSTVASIISVPDIVQVSTVINAREQRPIELYIDLAVIFFLICYGLSRLVAYLESRSTRRIFGDAEPL
jgi:glutamate/aspartate transport system permease protein